MSHFWAGIFCLPLAWLAVIAQAQDSAPVREIVVTAAGFEQALRDAPASISLVSRDELYTRQYRDLAEALKYVQGVDVRGGTGKTGGFNVSIRGMPSDYTLFMIDGIRQNAPTEVGQNGFGDALTSFMPPASAIERIEVIRGPMSTLYGSDAVGGVVNVITRPATREWRSDLTLEGNRPQNSRWGGMYKAGLQVSGPLIQDLLSLTLRGNHMQRQSSDRVNSTINPNTRNANTRDPAPPQSRQHSVGAQLTWTPDPRHRIWLDTRQDRTWYDNSDCRLGGFDFVNCNTSQTTTIAPGYRDALRFNRDQSLVAHRSQLDIGLLESSITYNETAFLGRTIASSARPQGHPDIGTNRTLKASNLLLDSKLLLSVADQHRLTLGMQYWQADLKDTFLAQAGLGQQSWSLFAEDEWVLTDTVTATLGLRYDNYQRVGGELTPRAYLVWKPALDWTLKGGSGRGYKAPQLHFMVDGISEVIRQGRQPNVGNPELQPEYSINSELAALFDNQRGLRGSATIFHNSIRDKIAFRGGNCLTDPIPSCIYGQTLEPFVTQFPVNMDEGSSWGLELSGNLPIAEQWALNGTFTWLDSKLIEDGVRSGALSDSANRLGHVQLRWIPEDRLRLWAEAEYRGSSRRFDGDPDRLTGNDLLEYQTLGELSAYSLLNLGGSYQVLEGVSLTANIFNVLNNSFTGHRVWVDNAGEIQIGSPYYRTDTWTKGAIMAGRTFRLSAVISL